MIFRVKGKVSTPSACMLLLLWVAAISPWSGHCQESKAIEGRESLGAFATYSPTSSHILIGESEERRVFTAGVEFTRTLLNGHTLGLEYAGDASPLFRETDPTMVGEEFTFGGVTNVTPLPPQRVIAVNHGLLGYSCVSTCAPIYPVYGKGESTYGFELSPLGMNLVLNTAIGLKPLFTANAGIIFSSRDIPVDKASQINYVFHFGPGLQFARHDLTYEADCLYRHISNANSGATNPGVDQIAWRLGISHRW